MDGCYLAILNKNLTDVCTCPGSLSQPQNWNKALP